MIYAVIDTNVIVSSLKSAHPDSATVRVMDAVYCGKVKIIVNDAILAEYDDVLHRSGFNLMLRGVISFCRLYLTLVCALTRSQRTRKCQMRMTGSFLK